MPVGYHVELVGRLFEVGGDLGVPRGCDCVDAVEAKNDPRNAPRTHCRRRWLWTRSTRRPSSARASMERATGDVGDDDGWSSAGSFLRSDRMENQSSSCR